MKNLKIAIIGSGVVGQATGKGFMSKGFEVTFIDVNPYIIEKLREEGYDAYLASDSLNALDTDISIFTVPTPTVDGEINLKYLKAAAVDLGKRIANMKKYHLAVVRSTVVPGTTEGLVLKTLEKHSGKKVGKGFGLCMNPEYLREVSAVEDFANPWIVVIGNYDEKSGDLLERVYKRFNCPIYKVPIKEAEMQKYVHNLYNACKITFFNEMREIAQSIKVDTENMFALVVKSCEGIWNGKYGTKNLGPFSGSCLPKDTQAFYAFAQSKGLEAELLETTISVNNKLASKIKRSSSEKDSRISDYPELPL
ncbi:UDP-glucose/GDP-mannose dehydrogenase family protein [Candidatus Daviesbacteria bacterium]|nr:UDP-glucose/GDP-mannose dehydrogenase family protein [Candidatus Daviesbacteria bacterium]